VFTVVCFHPRRCSQCAKRLPKLTLACTVSSQQHDTLRRFVPALSPKQGTRNRKDRYRYICLHDIDVVSKGKRPVFGRFRL
jgi:hypothetical protein